MLCYIPEDSDYLVSAVSISDLQWLMSYWTDQIIWIVITECHCLEETEIQITLLHQEEQEQDGVGWYWRNESKIWCSHESWYLLTRIHSMTSQKILLKLRHILFSTVYIAASGTKKVLDGLGNWNNVYNKMCLHLTEAVSLFIMNEFM
jgi:hypothetical protein